MGPLVSGMARPAATSANRSAGAISSPLASTAATGRLCTSTMVSPHAASTPV